MKNTLILVLITLCSVGATAQITGEKVFDMMYARHHGKWHKNVTFVQTTERYEYEVVTSKETWYEALQFPGDFRMDIGDTKNGNIILFHNGSLLKYQGHKNFYNRPDNNSIIFLEGGMYFYTSDSAKKLFAGYQYNLTKATETKLLGKEVYVIGVDSLDEHKNQIWVDKENLLVQRIIEYDGASKSDFVFEGHKKTGDSWIETKVTIYLDDKKVQAEYYNDIKVNQQLDARLFDPKNIENATHWYKGEDVK